MAFVYSPSVFAGIVTSLGISNAYLQLSQAGTAVSGLSQLQDSRNTIADSLSDNTITGTDFDASNTLAAALRTAEKNAPTAVATNYDTTLTALDTYFTTVVGSNLRTYWNSKTSNQTTTFTDNFRSFFRRVKADELIVKLYSVTLFLKRRFICALGKETRKIPGSFPKTTIIIFFDALIKLNSRKTFVKLFLKMRFI